MDKQELFKLVGTIEPEKSRKTGVTKSPEELKHIMILFLKRDKVIARRKLMMSLRWYGGSDASTFDPIMDELISAGLVVKSGDGKKGIMGNGPIVYTWIAG